MTENQIRLNEITTLPTVSVIVITYNQELSKLIQTLDSILIQEGLTFEIIICDDGSKKQYEDELRYYFTLKNFSQYTLVFHDHNKGTVSNYYSGLKIAKGRYSKLLSPGDFFTENDVLYKWLQFMKDNNAEWSFSDAYYYHSNNGKMNYLRIKAMPQMIRPYIIKDKDRCIWNYFAFNDIAFGAMIIGRTHTQLHFCRIIKDKGIKYCEDYIYRFMMFYGIVGCYFPNAAICYEYGTGVSTSGSNRWRKMLVEEKRKLIQILLNIKDKSELQKRIVNAMIIFNNSNKIRKLFIRGKIFHSMKCHFYPRLTPIPEESL